MGAEIGTAILLGAGMSMIGSVAGSAISGSQASAVNEDTMEFNHNEAEFARQWQEKMYNQQVADQRQNYLQFQSPEAIAKMLGKIGVNPAKIFSGGANGLGSMASVPSAPSGPHAGVSGLLNPGEYYAQGLQNVTKDAISMLNGLTDKNLKDTQIMHVLAQTANEQTMNKVLEFQALAAQYLPQKAANEISEQIAHIALLDSQGKHEDAMTATEKVMKDIAVVTKDMKSEEKNQLLIRGMYLAKSLQNELDLQEGEKKVQKSQQVANYASAAHQNALALESGTRRVGLEFENSIKKIDSEISAATAQNKLAAVSEALQKDANLDRRQKLQAQSEIEKLDKILKMYREHPNKAALDAALDNFNDHFPILGGFIKVFK